MEWLIYIQFQNIYLELELRFWGSYKIFSHRASLQRKIFEFYRFQTFKQQNSCFLVIIPKLFSWIVLIHDSEISIFWLLIEVGAFRFVLETSESLGKAFKDSYKKCAKEFFSIYFSKKNNFSFFKDTFQYSYK